MNSQTALRYLIPGLGIALASTLGVGPQNLAYAVTPTTFESHAITGQDLNNNPMVAKILSEIEYSKKQVADLQKNQKDLELNQKLIAEQRLIAKHLQDQAYQILQSQTSVNSSDNAYNRFLSTVQNNNTKLVFHDEFAFTKQRVSAGHDAMKKMLDNGGTYEEAIQEFSKYAAIKRVEMVEMNKNLNIKYGLADAKVQADFNSDGTLPIDYIKVPTGVASHSRT
ncbi:MAG: hypothetical protein D4R90_01790 [Nitrosopumilales archaeon]|nr:MAG: hypothetical protein D4R90_01790 [Nitrosopumilales archaeon]